MNHTRPGRCWAEIDLGALRRNAAVVRARVGGSAGIIAVIKANGYGHGLTRAAEALAADAEIFGVANLPEAIEARSVVPHPIMILGPALPEERAEIARSGFIPSVSNYEEAAAFDRIVRGSPVNLNFVIDTGMGRMGSAEAEAVAILKKIALLKSITIHSVSTHLPVADEDSQFTQTELSRFEKLIAAIRQEVSGAYRVHVLLSAGVLAFPDFAFDLVRAGLMLYGVSPLPDYQSRLTPALTLKSRIVLLRQLPADTPISYGRTFVTARPTRVATLAVGYADGYPRSLSNRGASVLIRGRRCALLGRVTMDLIMVDVTQLNDVQLGDEAVLIGRQGQEEILASELAQRAGTIPWEVFTGIGSRVARVYQGGAISESPRGG